VWRDAVQASFDQGSGEWHLREARILQAPSGTRNRTQQYRPSQRDGLIYCGSRCELGPCS
jgi:hypothetical protein